MYWHHDLKEKELTHFSKRSLKANNSTANDSAMQWFPSNINSLVI